MFSKMVLTDSSLALSIKPSIDHNDISILFMDHVFSTGFELPHQHFRIVNIFGTAQGDDVNLILLGRLSA